MWKSYTRFEAWIDLTWRSAAAAPATAVTAYPRYTSVLLYNCTTHDILISHHHKYHDGVHTRADCSINGPGIGANDHDLLQKSLQKRKPTKDP
jgi:hypothetical protein